LTRYGGAPLIQDRNLQRFASRYASPLDQKCGLAAAGNLVDQ
jgi:hypothetical protein